MFRKEDPLLNSDATIRSDLGSLTDRAGWVLVGGRSRRMGADKALIEIDGRALVLRVADEAAKACGSVALIGDPARYGALGLTVVEDTFPGYGPLGGIETALRVTLADHNLVLACDMPALDAASFEQLFAAGGDCAIPEYEDGRVEPLCAVYHRSCHEAVRAALMAGVRKVTDAFQGRSIRYVRVASDVSFANLNTPEDLRKYTGR